MKSVKLKITKKKSPKKNNVLSLKSKTKKKRMIKGLPKSVIRKYSSRKMSLRKFILDDTRKLIDQKLISNESLIQEFSEKDKKKRSSVKGFFNSVTNPQLMESILLLFKLTICLVIMPVLHYLLLGKNINLESLREFFLDKRFRNYFYNTLVSTSSKHLTATTYLTGSFLENSLGKILMKFSLFKGIIIDSSFMLLSDLDISIFCEEFISRQNGITMTSYN